MKYVISNSNQYYCGIYNALKPYHSHHRVAVRINSVKTCKEPETVTENIQHDYVCITHVNIIAVTIISFCTPL